MKIINKQIATRKKKSRKQETRNEYKKITQIEFQTIQLFYFIFVSPGVEAARAICSTFYIMVCYIIEHAPFPGLVGWMVREIDVLVLVCFDVVQPANTSQAQIKLIQLRVFVGRPKQETECQPVMQIQCACSYMP